MIVFPTVVFNVNISGYFNINNFIAMLMMDFWIASKDFMDPSSVLIQEINQFFPRNIFMAPSFIS
jgi:hypothetical protein